MKKILVVDDDELVRETLRRQLERFSFEVSDAEDGDVALEILLEVKDFDLVISDAKMPRLDGIDLLIECRNQFPHLPFILMSGFVVDEKRLPEVVPILKKPFSSGELLKLVEGFLSSD